jgi:hypothetical protein
MPWTTDVDPADDLFHVRNEDPYWNESHLTTFRVPEANLMGTIYYYFRPNMKLCVGGPIIWNGDGEDVYNCLYYAWDQCMAFPDAAEMNEFTFPNGLSVSTVDLQKQYRMTFEGPGCEIDLTYTALMEPHYMALEGQSINPAIIDWMTNLGPELSPGHYEQAGMMKGTVTVGNTTFEVDHTSLRDHTWGPRKNLTNMSRLRGAWPFAVASKDSSFQVYAMCEASLEDDPIVGTTERITSGWYTKDGIKGTLVSGNRRCVERGPDGRPIRDIVEATDDLGRELYAEGTYLTWLKFPCYSDCMPWWGLTRWEYDGQTVFGEDMDYIYAKHNRKLWEAVSGTGRSLVSTSPAR